MSIEARLETLHQRHRELESALNEEANHPAFDEHKIQDIKRKKLAIKDEMAQLQAHTPN